MVMNCVSPDLHVTTLTLRTLAYDCIWRQGLERNDYMKMRGSPIQSGPCPPEGRRTQTRTEGRPQKGTGRTRYLHAKESGLRRNQPCRPLDLRLLYPRGRRHQVVAASALGPWCFVMAGQDVSRRGRRCAVYSTDEKRARPLRA